ncbi:MAG: DUF327 family protein [Treponema sp.]|jgi:uncharacterized protein YaaR (DUF327 family)|nr:DUF327 family protein [Treponema sp.]
MANIVFPDGASPLFNPAVYGEAGAEARKAKSPSASRGEKTGKVKKRPFASMFEKARDAALPEELSPSEESLHLLLDDVHSTGDALSRRPFPQEVKEYKQAVRNFVHYVVENSYGLEKFQTKYREMKGRIPVVKLQVIDKKLEELAAAVMRGQMSQLSILGRTDEIKGLLVDLLE